MDSFWEGYCGRFAVVTDVEGFRVWIHTLEVVPGIRFNMTQDLLVGEDQILLVPLKILREGVTRMSKKDKLTKLIKAELPLPVVKFSLTFTAKELKDLAMKLEYKANPIWVNLRNKIGKIPGFCTKCGKTELNEVDIEKLLDKWLEKVFK